MAMIQAASPGLVLLACADGTWIVQACGPLFEPAILDDLVERYEVTATILITAQPALSQDEARAATRIAYKSLAHVADLDLRGFCPPGAALSPEDYLSVHRLTGAALASLYRRGLFNTTCSSNALARGQTMDWDDALNERIAAMAPDTMTILRVDHPLPLRVARLETDDHILLAGSRIAYHPATTDLAQAGILLDYVGGGALRQAGDGILLLRWHRRFAGLEDIARFAFGSRQAEQVHWYREQPGSVSP